MGIGHPRRWFSRRAWRRSLLATALTAVLAAGGIGYGVAQADIPDNAVINGCYNARTGFLRVIDTSANQSCYPSETPLSWNQQGPGGPQGPAGPPGPAGAVSKLDDLNGIPCDGVNGKPATVRVTYGTGVEAPVTLLCVTHLVANPGPFTFKLTSGDLSTSLTDVGFSAGSGWTLSGQIDYEGKITIPADATLASVPFDNTVSDVNGFTNVHLTGSFAFASTAVSGSLDPATGTATLNTGIDAVLNLTATADILGTVTQIYSGTCNFGSATAPIPVSLTTSPPGVPYSQTTGSVTLTAPFSAPSLDGCNPAIPSLYAFLLNLFAGSDRLTLSGVTSPVITAP